MLFEPKNFFAAAILLVVLASLMGWGALVRRLEGASRSSAPVTMAIGLSCVVAIGGLLNLAGIAYAFALWTLLAGGLALFVLTFRVREISAPQSRTAWIEAILAGGFILAVVAFTIVTQLPPKTFNWIDDFQKYFAHPVRMLATGTLAGSPLSALGTETLGGQAFLHAFPASLFPLEFMNGVDAVLGLLLALLLGASAGWRRLAPLPGALLAPLLIVCINPQYVNISALYLCAALIAAAVMLVTDPRESPERPTLSLGLIYAALISLKPIFALFVVLHLSFLVAGWMAAERKASSNLFWAVRIAAFAALALLPWILMHAALYLAAMDAPAMPPVPGGVTETFNPLSVRSLLYGSTPAHYSALGALALLAAIYAAITLKRGAGKAGTKTAVGVLAAAGAAIVSFVAMVFFLAPLLSGVETNLRYTIPLLIGAVPAALVLAASLHIPFPRPAAQGIAVAALCAVAIAFLPNLAERAQRMARSGSAIAFSTQSGGETYLAANRAALSGEGARNLEKVQRVIPADETFVAWIATPFLLDFSRNRILDAEPAGLSMPWAHVPSGVRYIVWEYRGPSINSRQQYLEWAQSPGRRERQIATRAFAFAERLRQASTGAEILHNDGQIAVLRLKEDLRP